VLSAATLTLQLDQVWPVTGGTPFFIATRVETANQTLVCETPSAADPSCSKTYEFGCDASFEVKPDCENFAQSSYFVADIERFTLLLDHTVQSPTEPSLKGDAATMQGYLKSCNGCVPCMCGCGCGCGWWLKRHHRDPHRQENKRPEEDIRRPGHFRLANPPPRSDHTHRCVSGTRGWVRTCLRLLGLGRRYRRARNLLFRRRLWRRPGRSVNDPGRCSHAVYSVGVGIRVMRRVSRGVLACTCLALTWVGGCVAGMMAWCCRLPFRTATSNPGRGSSPTFTTRMRPRSLRGQNPRCWSRCSLTTLPRYGVCQQ